MGKNNGKKAAFSIFFLLFLIIFSSFLSASCTISGQILNKNNEEVNRINVNISIDGNNPSRTTSYKHVPFNISGYYEQSFGSECVQGDSRVYVIAYNSTHYGKNIADVLNKSDTSLDVVIEKRSNKDLKKDSINNKKYLEFNKNSDDTKTPSEEEMENYREFEEKNSDKRKNNKKDYKSLFIWSLLGIMVISLLFVARKKKVFKLKKLSNKKEG